MRRILHVDMDAFFAAVELQRLPELAGRPVIIGGSGDPRQRGVVSTASYEARRFGVHSGMPLRIAWQLCPQAVFLPVDYEAYERVSRRIKAILRRFSPVMEDLGIDEAFLDIAPLVAPPEEIARQIKARIRAETGLSCSVGIAPNKLLAKMASDLEKPDGLTVLAEEDVPARIWPLPVRKLWGVGPKTEERLRAMGVTTIGELARRPLDRLTDAFGPAHGTSLFRAARGIDDSPLVTRWEPKSVSREVTFQKDVAQRRVLLAVLGRLAREVAERLREEELLARTVTVKLRYLDFETHTHAVTLEKATDQPKAVLEAARRCFDRFSLNKKVRLLGVRASGLETDGEGDEQS